MELTELVKNYKVFIDTSTWMFPNSENFLTYQLPPILLETKEHIKVPVRIVEEVNRLMKSEDKEKRHKAKKAGNHLRSYFSYNIARAYGTSNDPFADQTFLYVFQQFRVKHNLALITQDRGLAHDILNLNNQRAVQGKRIYAFRINNAGKLEQWNEERLFHANVRTEGSKPAAVVSTADPVRRNLQQSLNPNPDKVFNLGTKVVSEKENVMPVAQVPDVNETVYSSRFGSLQLQEELGSGGEGKIFLASNGMICKIYKKERITHERFYKLKRMLEVPIEKAGICWPKDIIKNGRNEFVGYIMEKADGKPMQTAMFQKPVLQKNFPHWTRKDLVQLVISILGKIIYLHERNIIIGDINPLNILIKNEKEVYFVDTDSYQIENYPCPVGTINFTPPNLQGKNFSTFLRTFNDEYFAVNTLIFMTLLPGKPPYSQLGGGSPGENIKKMDFPYPCGEKGKGTAPDGPWKYIWSHLPFKLKEALYDTFTGEKRATPEELRDLLVEYRQLITRGRLSDDLFPIGHKIPEGKEATLICTDKKCQNPHVTVHIDFKNKIEKRGVKFICDDCKNRRKAERQAAELWNLSNPQAQQQETRSPVSGHRSQGTGGPRPNVTNSHTQRPQNTAQPNRPKPTRTTVNQSGPVKQQTKPSGSNQTQHTSSILDSFIRILKKL
ncbi:hypothetical protein [Neobacillus dielmonensis]|uniref:hypothetical protein n=1 Tax=Neobacillus dielmonensis TaxID=1347369 RepID=UPI0006940BEB|nr:hypothetical protein [Neobacillus dielmonensis]